MRTDMLRWGGVAAVVLALLFAGVLLLGFAMGADIYADDETDELLRDIDENGAAFVVWSLTSLFAELLLIPVLVGLFYAVREHDRPYYAIVAALFGVSMMFAMVGFATGPVLWDVASNYVDAEGAAQTALLHDGENLQSQLLATTGVAFMPFGLALAGAAILSLRSGFFPAWLAWPAVLIGVVSLLPFVGFIAAVPGRIAWLLVTGVILVHRSRGERSTPAVREASPMPA